MAEAPGPNTLLDVGTRLICPIACRAGPGLSISRDRRARLDSCASGDPFEVFDGGWRADWSR